MYIYDIVKKLIGSIEPVGSSHVDEERLKNPDLSEDTVAFYQQRIVDCRRQIIPQVEATQVKEKYGGLCFYVNNYNDVIDAYISFAESMSYCVCEKCGKSGKPNDGGWIITLCDDCRKGVSNGQNFRFFRQTGGIIIGFFHVSAYHLWDCGNFLIAWCRFQAFGVIFLKERE